jgi:hypothetical protein
MGGHGGSFRTTVGKVTVDGDGVRISKEPRAHVRRQLTRWRHGERWDRVRAAFSFGLTLVLPPLLVFHLLETWETATAGVLAFVFVMTGLQLFLLWRHYTRETEIPCSDVSGVMLDPEERELTVRFDAGTALRPPDGTGLKTYWSDEPMRTFETGTTERTVTLPTDDDVRDARSAFRLAGIDVDEGSGASEAGRYDGETETETAYRVTTRSGVVFCEDCGSQVSPSDKTCPVCDCALWVDRPVEDDRRETALEY